MHQRSSHALHTCIINNQPVKLRMRLIRWRSKFSTLKQPIWKKPPSMETSLVVCKPVALNLFKLVNRISDKLANYTIYLSVVTFVVSFSAPHFQFLCYLAVTCYGAERRPTDSRFMALRNKHKNLKIESVLAHLHINLSNSLQRSILN